MRALFVGITLLFVGLVVGYALGNYYQFNHGEFENGVFQGLGSYQYADGGTYEGYFLRVYLVVKGALQVVMVLF